MTDLLTTGAIQKLFEGEKVKDPIVQLINLRAVASADPNAPKKVKMDISDGKQKGTAAMTSALALQCAEGKIGNNMLVKLKQYVVNSVGSMKLCIVMGAEVIDSEVMETIGEPVAWSGRASGLEVKVEAQSSSPAPKDGPKINTPTTANVSSRVGAANLASGARGPSSFSSSPPQPAAAVALDGARATPIGALNPYNTRWMVKVRVMSKGDLRTYQSKQGEGSLFSFDLCDDSGEIRATCFREIAERFYPMIEVGKVYLIAKGQLKMANKKFSTLNNQYEMTLGYETQIQPCNEEISARIHYNFIPVSEIEARSVNATVDIIGVVDNIASVTRLTSSKTGKEMIKRTMQLSDDSGKGVELTLWGSSAENFPEDNAQVVAFKGLRVTEWNQRSLSLSSGGSYEINPELEATERLKSWWTDGGAGTVQSLTVDTRGASGAPGANDTSRTDFASMQEVTETMSEDSKGEYFNVRCYVSRINPREDSPMWYASCPKCNKKVIGDEVNGCNCENCGWSGHDCAYRYMLAVVAVDATGSQWLTAFNEQATALLGKPADQLKRIKDQSPQEFEEIVSRAKFQPLTMRMRAKKETYNGNTRPKVHVMAPKKMDFVTEARSMLDEIAKYDLPPPDTSAVKEEVKAESD